MLINLSNHPLEKWQKNQTETAKKLYGTLRDLPFPQINPNWDEDKVEEYAKLYFDEILAILESSSEPANAVHVMGELTFTFNLVTKLLKRNIECVASTTERQTTEDNNSKLSVFNFVKFRKYK